MTKDKQKTYSVYIHTVPNGKVYIGITSRKPEKRWNYGYGYANNKHFDQAIRKYGWDSIKHEIVASGLSRSEAEKMERKFIAEYQSDDREHGYNILKGGNVSDGGWHHTEEAKRRIAIGATGRHLSKEQIQALVERRIRGVRAYDINGNFIKEYKSLTDAERETGIENSNIAACCKGKYATMSGYIFRYSDDDRPVEPYYGKWRRVCQYTVDGEYIKTFSKITEAADAVGVHRHHITNVCKFKMISSGGYLWLYENEQNRIEEKVQQYRNKKRKSKIA